MRPIRHKIRREWDKQICANENCQVFYSFICFLLIFHFIVTHHILLTIVSQILNNAQLPLNTYKCQVTRSFFAITFFCSLLLFLSATVVVGCTADMEMVIFMIMSIYYDDKHCVWIFHYTTDKEQKKHGFKQKKQTHTVVIVLLLSFPKKKDEKLSDSRMKFILIPIDWIYFL